MPYQGLIHRYRTFLPLADCVTSITLHEGNTPLIRLRNLPKFLKIDVKWYVKYEGLNPTGSFKDRGMTVAVTQAISEGYQAILCASTGNTSASAAAYAARAGIRSFVLIPAGQIALGKLAQARIHGAKVIQINGNFDRGMALVKDIVNETPVALVNSVNPFRLQGQKTAAFEIVDSLGRAPDYHILPVGNAGNISAHWMGYKEYEQAGKSDQLPKMIGIQAEGAAPFINGKVVDSPETIATAIRIGAPQSWDLAIAAKQASEGWFDTVTDKEILNAQHLLATHEGIFCEPASCAAIAGVIKAYAAGKMPQEQILVSTLTGHGLKDPDIAVTNARDEVVNVDASYDKVKSLILNTLNM